MDFRNHSELMRRADQSLSGAAYDPKKLILVYTGTTALVMLLVTAANFLLQSQIAGTGGLSGLAMRSMLETAIQVLQTGVNLLLPFWTFGYLSCVLRMTRGQAFDLQGLLEGFRHFGPVLRLTLLRGGYFLMVGLMCIYPSMMIFMWTPFSQPFQQIIEPFMSQDATEIVLDDATLAAATEALAPMLVIYGILFLIFSAPKFYSFRMADYCLLDHPKEGALMAIRRSTLMLHRNRLGLLKLDLRFWWFYLLDALTVALCYGDTLLFLTGITLPLDQNVAYFLFFGLYLIAQIGLYVWMRNKVECTYAAAYECLNRELEEKLQQIMDQQAAAKNPQDV